MPAQRIEFSGLPWLRFPLDWQHKVDLALSLLGRPTSSVCSRILGLLEQASCGRSDRRAPGSPAIADAPGWIKTMPNSHHGYYDRMLNMGYLGLALLIVFIIATLHAMGRVADRAPARAWLVLTLALYVIVYNSLEVTWVHGFKFEWLVFLILAAEIGRYWQPLPLRRAAYRLRRGRPGGFGPSPGPQSPRFHSRLS